MNEHLKDKVEVSVVGATSEASETIAVPKGKLASKIEKIKDKPRKYTLDLRIHSPASLGYIAVKGLDTAPALVKLAKAKGIDVIAITDFYSGAFIDRAKLASEGSQVTVIPGVDLRCKVGFCDDLLFTVLFPLEFTSEHIEEFLNEIKVPLSQRGNQDYILESTSLEKVIQYAEYHNAAIFPARIDMSPLRMQILPELVEKYGFRTFDIAYPESEKLFAERWPKLKFNLYSFSEANALAQVGSRTAELKLASTEFAGIRKLFVRAETARGKQADQSSAVR